MALMLCEYPCCPGYVSSHICSKITNVAGGTCGNICHAICMTAYCSERERNEGSGGSRCFLCSQTTPETYVEIDEDKNVSKDDREDEEVSADYVIQDTNVIDSMLRYSSLLEILKNDPANGPRADEFRPSVTSGVDCLGWCEDGCQNYKFVSQADKSNHISIIHNLRADNRPKVGAASKTTAAAARGESWMRAFKVRFRAIGRTVVYFFLLGTSLKGIK